MNRRHYVIYFDDELLIETTPKDWARENENLFPDYNFDVEMPTSNKIESYLVAEKGFTRIESKNRVITLEL
jgi:hypothetical protein